MAEKIIDIKLNAKEAIKAVQDLDDSIEELEGGVSDLQRGLNDLERELSEVTGASGKDLAKRKQLNKVIAKTKANLKQEKEALKQNDMNEFISELRDAIHTQGKSSSGLSMRRAKEANMIGENLDDWTPIHKVVVSGTRANPTFEWQTEAGEVVETYTSDRSLHSGNITDKPNQTDTLNEEIIL